MKLNYQKLWLVLWCWTNAVPIKQSMRLTNLSEGAVRRWFSQFRAHLPEDGASIYQSIHKWWPVRHQSEVHSKWEFELTSEIEGLFGNLRTFIRRMYHHTTPEKLPEIVREFCFRFSSPEIFQNPSNYLEKSLKLVPFD